LASIDRAMAAAAIDTPGLAAGCHRLGLGLRIVLSTAAAPGSLLDSVHVSNSP
jgi:hypothetical protein